MQFSNYLSLHFEVNIWTFVGKEKKPQIWSSLLVILDAHTHIHTHTHCPVIFYLTNGCIVSFVSLFGYL